MPNLYSTLCGVSRYSEPPSIGQVKKQNQNVKRSKTANSDRKGVLTKSKSFMFLERPVNNYLNDDEDEEQEIILASSPTTSVASSIERSGGGLEWADTNFNVKKDKPIQRKAIHDVPPQVAALTVSEGISSSVFPGSTLLDKRNHKRKFEIVNSKWNDNTPMISLSHTQTNSKFSSQSQEESRKRKKQSNEIYKTQSKSLWQSLFEL